MEEIIINSIAQNGTTAILVCWLLLEGRKELKELVSAFNSLAESFKKVSNLNDRLDRIEKMLESK